MQGWCENEQKKEKLSWSSFNRKQIWRRCLEVWLSEIVLSFWHWNKPITSLVIIFITIIIIVIVIVTLSPSSSSSPLQSLAIITNIVGITTTTNKPHKHHENWSALYNFDYLDRLYMLLWFNAQLWLFESIVSFRCVI